MSDPIQPKLTPAPMPTRDDTAQPPKGVKTFQQYRQDSNNAGYNGRYPFDPAIKMLNDHAQLISDLQQYHQSTVSIFQKYLTDLNDEIEDILKPQIADLSKKVQKLEGRVGKPSEPVACDCHEDGYCEGADSEGDGSFCLCSEHTKCSKEEHSLPLNRK